MSDYRHDLLFLLNDVARLVRTEADRRAREDGVTRAQWGILIWLEREPGLSQRELAERLEVEPITVARLIDRLEARGMVERRPDPADRRIWRMHLRPEAAPVLAEVERHRHEILAGLTAGLDAQTRRTVVEALAHMKDLLCAERRADPAPPARPPPRAPVPIGAARRAAADDAPDAAASDDAGDASRTTTPDAASADAGGAAPAGADDAVPHAADARTTPDGNAPIAPGGRRADAAAPARRATRRVA